MKIGIVSLWWPPHHGGGEIYICRLTSALRRAGIAVQAITTSPAMADRDGGDFDVLRCGVSQAPTAMKAFRDHLQGPDHAAWCGMVAEWAETHRFTHVLCNAPLMRPGFSPVMPELLGRLRATGARIGAIQHDLPPRVATLVLQHYAATQDWERTAAGVLDELRDKLRARGPRVFHDTYASPLHFEPDFVLGCSAWSLRFVDPQDTVPKLVLHPLLPPVAAAESATAPLAAVDVAMINPLPQKGALQMANIILFNRRRWRFRVLQGGWGEAFASFTPLIADALHARERRVAMVPYLRDVAPFFRAARVFVQPSRIEGYGMAAVEAMQEATPVVTTDYPAIREAVGDDARIVAYDADGRDWIEAIADVLAHRDTWQARATARIATLRHRESEELPALVAFLARQGTTARMARTAP